MADLIVGARTFLPRRQDILTIYDAILRPETSLFKISAIDVSHFNDISQVHVLGLHPGHQLLRI